MTVNRLKNLFVCQNCSHSNNKFFSVEGLEICLKYFLDRGYDAKAIVPQMRLKKSRSSNADLLAKLESEGRLVFSPCKNLPSGQKIISYDDRFILDFAVDCDAAVISNDNYRDLSKESDSKSQLYTKPNNENIDNRDLYCRISRGNQHTRHWVHIFE